MPKSTGRGVLFAALAVPIAMVITPLTASAEADVEFSPGPDWYEYHYGYNSDDDNVTYVINGIHEDSDIGNSAEETEVDVDVHDDFSPGPDWYDYEYDEVIVVNEDGSDDNTTVVVNGIHENSDVGNSEEETDVEVDLVEHDEGGYEHEVVDEVVEDHGDGGVEVVEVDGDDDDYWSGGWSGASYSDVAAAAGPEGAWVDSTESAAFSDNGGFGHVFDGDGVSGAFYESVNAGAGSEGAFTSSTESAAFDGLH